MRARRAPGVAALVLGLALLAAACGDGADGTGDGTAPAGGDGELTVGEAWTAEATDVAAVYLTVTNGGPADRLVGARTEAATTVSAMSSGGIDPSSHESHGSEHGPELDVPPGTTTLAPGGTHIMLEGLTRPLAPGDRVTLELSFAEAGPRTVTVEVLGWDTVVERIDGAAPGTGGDATGGDHGDGDHGDGSSSDHDDHTSEGHDGGEEEERP